jgi:hypothetical protein
MAHQTKRLFDTSGKKIIVTDNFFTRHVLEKQEEILTDGEIKMIGTVKFINIDGISHPLVKEAMEKIQNCEKVSWMIHQAFDKSVLNAEQSRIPAEKTGYIVFKVHAVVVFFTNDLAGTFSLPLQGCNEVSIRCI